MIGTPAAPTVTGTTRTTGTTTLVFGWWSSHSSPLVFFEPVAGIVVRIIFEHLDNRRWEQKSYGRMAERTPGRAQKNYGTGEYQLPRASGSSPARGKPLAMYNELYSWDNLLAAYRKAAKGKRGCAPAAAFEYHLEDNLLSLQRSLQDMTYQPGHYESFYIHEPKRRLISAAPFRDRVVHHALCNLIEPIFERSFIVDSYANRHSKGTHRALDRAQTFSRAYRYVLQCDIRQFFPSIDHALLTEELTRKISDERVLWLCRRIIGSGEGVLSEEYEMIWFSGDNLLAIERPRGLPIGNLTSQFWANVYLNAFDHFVKRELKCHAYLRYVDDFLLFANDKKVLWFYKTAIEQRLAGLRVAIHPGAHPRPVTEGFPFLGFVIFPDRRRLKRRKGIQFQRKLGRMIREYKDGNLSFEVLNASVLGWVNHTRYGNTLGLRKAVLSRRGLEVKST